jgi:NADP-dependent 3-hydroxy acid dehydrogenase YdfG
VRVYAAARRTALLESLKAEVGGDTVVPVELDVSDADRTHVRVRRIDA